MPAAFKEQFNLVYNWVISLAISIFTGGISYRYIETGHFFYHAEHDIEGGFAASVAIWLLGVLVAKLAYTAQKKFEQTGDFPSVNIPGRVYSQFYSNFTDNFQKKNVHLDALEKAFKIFRISIIFFSFILIIAAFVMHWLGITISL